MKHILALPALLRASLYLAAASPNTFSPMEDLLAFPQYEVRFTESYVSELDAQSKLQASEQLDLNTQGGDADALQEPPPSQVQQYQGDAGDRRVKDEPKLEYEYMVLDGQKYICSIPQIKLANSPSARGNPTANDTISQLEEEKELARATDRGWELLSGMQGNCVYFVSGWWSYRFCYGQGVKQFHQLPPSRGVPVYPPVEDPSVAGYELGNYDGGPAPPAEEAAEPQGSEESGVESALDVTDGAKVEQRYSGQGELVQRGESRYLVQRLGGGTTCDLTGKERRVEVQFHCNPQSSDRISLIKETATCAYLMVIQTPRLCSDVAFLPPQKDQPHGISCSPVMTEDEAEEYQRDLERLKSEEDEAAKLWDAALASATDLDLDALQIVGDIVIGGHAIVPVGTKIEKSGIVGGGKETYIDTVASSDGRILSEEDMKKLGLGDPRAVEKLRKDLEKIAQGQQWKLDVIDTPRGREYRGIIGDEDEEKEGGEGKKTKGGGKKGKQVKQDDGDGEKETKEQKGSEEEYYKEEL